MKFITAVRQLVDWFVPLEYCEEEFQQCRARLVVFFSLFLAMWGPFFVIVYVFTPGARWEALGMFGAMLMLAQVPFTFRYTRSLALAGNLLVLNIFLLVCYFSFVAGGYGAPPLAWNTALPMFAIATVGYRYGLMWAAITLFTFSAFYGYDQLGYRVAQQLTDAQLNSMKFVGLCGMLLLILSMTMLYESQQQQAKRVLKAAKDKIVETGSHLQAIVNNAADGILTFDTSGIVRSFNPAAERLFGNKSAEVIGQPLKRLMPLPSPLLEKAYVGGRGKEHVERGPYGGQRTIAQRKGGQSFPLDVAVGKAILNDKPLFICILRDVTEQVIAEEQRQQLVAMIEHSSDFIAIAGLDYRMSYLNAAGRDLVGISRNAQVSETLLSDYFTEEAWATMCELAIPAVVNTGAWQGEGQLQHVLTGRPIAMRLNMFLFKHMESPSTLCMEAVLTLRPLVPEPALAGVA